MAIKRTKSMVKTDKSKRVKQNVLFSGGSNEKGLLLSN